MNPFSMSKRYAVVTSVVVSALMGLITIRPALAAGTPPKPVAAAPAATAKPPAAPAAANVTTTVEDPNAARIRAEQEERSAMRTLKENWDKDCEQKKKEANEAKAQFISACKVDQRKKIEGAGPVGEQDSLNKRMEIIKKCTEDFDQCLEQGKEDLDIPGMTASMPGMEAFGAFSSALGDLNDGEKRCSKYSAADHKSALEKAESALDTKNKSIQDLTEKIMTSQEKAQEDYERMQKDFIDAQQKKTKSDLERKENDRNQRAAYEKQLNDYKEKVSQLNMEIVQLQEQMALQLRNKGSEVDAFKLELLGCKEQARLGIKGASGGQGQQATPTGPQSNLLGATQSSSKQIYQICAGNALRKRQLTAQDFNSKIKLMQMNLDMKMKSLTSIQESAASFQDMFNKAKADQQSAAEAEDRAFYDQQSKQWQNMQSRVNNMQTKSMQNQQFLQKANTEMNKASKRVAALEGEEPVAGKKGAEELKESLSKYEGFERAAVLACDKAKSANGTSGSTTPGPANSGATK